MDFGKIRSLTQDDEKTFQLYKAGIQKAVKEAFPSLPANFEAKAVGVSVVDACALLYTYIILLPDGQFAEVNFSVGGLPAPGTVKMPEPTFRVDPKPNFSIDS